MDKSAAIQLVQNTFLFPFEENKFKTFSRNLFKGLIEKEEKAVTGKYIRQAFSNHIASYKRIGKYIDENGDELDVLIVKLKKLLNLSNARTLQRNFIADYLQNPDKKSDSAIVAFYSDDSLDWRFSFVKVDSKVVITEKGIRTSTTLSEARRYSFLVGENEPTHTAQQQITPLLEREDKYSISTMESAFNIESITKEFFNKYKELFLELKEELDNLTKKDSCIKEDFFKHELTSEAFAKKLLGQIVFLYFLQKKGWLGVKQNEKWGTGSKSFLKDLFTQNNYKNFFNDVLEFLFYDALAFKHENDFYGKFKCKFPFLNGGLFDPINDYDWQKTNITISSSTFEKIFKTFDLYNFTVKEDEPYEKEVAIDPEMLGKVFENLLEVKDRKSKGAFYTPREIVHYMCQESLINYLDVKLNTEKRPIDEPNAFQGSLFGDDNIEDKLTEDVYIEKVPKKDIEEFIRRGDIYIDYAIRNRAKRESGNNLSGVYKERELPQSIIQRADKVDDLLHEVKICDPAIGSGAFPVGLMNEIIRARYALSAYGEPNLDRTIYNFKRHCIKESIYGVDIEPSAVEIAKLRLWLSLIVDEEDLDSIEPLPNLDYKIVCGNSLLGVETEGHLFNHTAVEQIEKLKQDYFESTDRQEKIQLHTKIDDILYQLTGQRNCFDYKIHFSEVFKNNSGFDIVIGNPPYGAAIDKQDLVKIKKNINDTNNHNSAALFIDYGKNRIIRKNGTLSFIVPKSLLYSERWFSLSKALIKKTLVLIDVEKAFEKVKLEQAVFIYNGLKERKNYIAKKFLNNQFLRTETIENKNICLFKAWICDVSQEDILIAKKMSLSNQFMRDISETKRGIGLQKFLKDNGDYPVIGGANISSYMCLGIKGFLPKEEVLSHKTKLEIMLQPKIISQDIVAHIQNPFPHIKLMSYFDETGKILSLDTVQNTVLTNFDYEYKYILCILNSKLTNWYTYKFIYCSAIRTMHFDKYYIGKIPIFKLNIKAQQPFIDLVDIILVKKGKGEDTTKEEKQIDQMVYELYDLTPEEIAIVEGTI